MNRILDAAKENRLVVLYPNPYDGQLSMQRKEVANEFGDYLKWYESHADTSDPVYLQIEEIVRAIATVPEEEGQKEEQIVILPKASWQARKNVPNLSGILRRDG